MSGRASRGEQWRFSSIDHELRVEIDGALRYLERYDMSPGGRGPARRWSCGSAQYVGTTILHHAAATSDAAERLHVPVSGVAGVTAAVDLPEAHLVVARFLSGSGPSFSKARSTFRTEALATIFGSPHLAPRR